LPWKGKALGIDKKERFRKAIPYGEPFPPSVGLGWSAPLPVRTLTVTLMVDGLTLLSFTPLGRSTETLTSCSPGSRPSTLT
jgi:hypothetical protein